MEDGQEVVDQTSNTLDQTPREEDAHPNVLTKKAEEAVTFIRLNFLIDKYGLWLNFVCVFLSL
jgi:hypothetical protein